MSELKSEKIKTLKQYVRAKKLPIAKLLGNVSDDWVNYALDISEKTKISTEKAIDNRTDYGTVLSDEYRKGILDQSIVDYKQKHIEDLVLPNDIFSNMEGIHELRFAELESKELLPLHLDSPWTLRFLIILKGSNLFFTEEESFPMNTNEIWFINGAHAHGVNNTNNFSRIALLGKWKYNENNIEKLL